MTRTLPTRRRRAKRKTFRSVSWSDEVPIIRQRQTRTRSTAVAPQVRRRRRSVLVVVVIAPRRLLAPSFSTLSAGRRRIQHSISGCNRQAALAVAKRGRTLPTRQTSRMCQKCTDAILRPSPPSSTFCLSPDAASLCAFRRPEAARVATDASGPTAAGERSLACLFVRRPNAGAGGRLRSRGRRYACVCPRSEL